MPKTAVPPRKVRVCRFDSVADIRCPFCNNRDIPVSIIRGSKRRCYCPDCRDIFVAVLRL